MQSGVTFSFDSWIVLGIAFGVFAVFAIPGIVLSFTHVINMDACLLLIFIGMLVAVFSEKVVPSFGFMTNINMSTVQKGYNVSDIKADGPSGSHVFAYDKSLYLSLYLIDGDGAAMNADSIGAVRDAAGKSVAITQNVPVSFRADGRTESGRLGMTDDGRAYLLMKQPDGSFVDYTRYAKDGGGSKTGTSDKTKAKSGKVSPTTKEPDYDYTQGVAYGGTR